MSMVDFFCCKLYGVFDLVIEDLHLCVILCLYKFLVLFDFSFRDITKHIIQVRQKLAWRCWYSQCICYVVHDSELLLLYQVAVV